MSEIMNYIFRSLSDSEKSIDTIYKTLNKQVKFNQKLTTVTFFICVGMLFLELDCAEQKKKIEKMRKEIEEIKCNKGE